MSYLNRAERSAVVALCVYEVAAICTGRVPTVSWLCRQHRYVEVGLLLALLAHLHHKYEVVPRRV